MKAYVFSIGEKTTDLCCELMTEYGYDVVLYQDQTTLWEKLKRFYTEALQTSDKFFVRIDADIIPFRTTQELIFQRSGWTCASGYDWYKMDIGAISIHSMGRDVIEKCLKHIEEAKDENRPESYLWRLDDINKSTRIDERHCFGIHGYAQNDSRDRIKTLKKSRNQDYNWELVEKIEKL